METSRDSDALMELLSQIRRGEDTNKLATRKLRAAVLALGSATDDNLNCVEHIEVGSVRRLFGGPLRNRGLKVRGKPIMISDVIHTLEDSRMPAVVRHAFPALTSKEWDACLRLVTLILISLEQEEWPKENT